MSTKVFVDTGAFFAFIDRDDPYYLLAYKTWSELLQAKATFYISDYILAETYTLLRYKLPQPISEYFLHVLEQTRRLGRLKVKKLTPQREKDVWDLLISNKEEELSYTDATSFVLIEQLKIQKVFTFDSHFKILDVDIIPNR